MSTDISSSRTSSSRLTFPLSLWRAWQQSRRRFLIPEIVQTSSMDCGPASLKCLLEGFGIQISYGRLREACQTDVDGTSLNTLEQVAVQLGLEAEQIILPADHLLLPQARALPAIAVVCSPSGLTHFIVIWRVHGRLVQVMDPATGRRWPTRQQMLNELYIHTIPAPASAWREWTETAEFVGAVCQRLAKLGLSLKERALLAQEALQHPAWQPIAILDAACRMVDSLTRSGGLKPGRQAKSLLRALFDRGLESASEIEKIIPAAYWSVQSTTQVGPQGEEQLIVRGAVLVRVLGRLATGSISHLIPEQPKALTDEQDISKGQAIPKGEDNQAAAGMDKSRVRDEAKAPSPSPLSPELEAALHERPLSPSREILKLLAQDGFFSPLLLLAALALAALSVIAQALLFRSLFDLGRELGLSGQRFEFMAAIVIFAIAALLLELPIAAELLRLGRHLEMRLRLAFMEKLPRLHDRYFQSRLTSDMAERSHSVHLLRLLPSLGGQIIRTAFELILTVAAICWLYPASGLIALAAAVLSLGLPLAVNPWLAERNLRVRNHAGALSRFYLDALLGLVPIRAHGAQRAVRREHEDLLIEWARAGFGFQSAVVMIEGLSSLIGFGLAAWLLFSYLAGGGEPGGVLLLVYWALNLPNLGQTVAMLARQYPNQRNVALRLIEPLGAPEESTTEKAIIPRPHSPGVATNGLATNRRAGVSLHLEGVSVRAAGQIILEDITLAIEPASHVAIVGRSGAGKSTLVGLFLGWYRPCAGRILVDGCPLTAERLERLRRQTAWIDPAVHLWNRSLLENLLFGVDPDQELPIGQAIKKAGLQGILGRLASGFQTRLGEDGRLVSGGEGQRVRLGRAMIRPGVRLVILDEPFRGLDYQQRRELLANSRTLWPQATLLCITHDIAETKTFDQVLVMEGGRIVESGSPADLAQRANSRYRALAKAQEMVRKGFWSAPVWRKLRLEGGQLTEATDALKEIEEANRVLAGQGDYE